MANLLCRVKLYAPTLYDEGEAKWFARSCCTTKSRTRLATSNTSSCAARCPAATFRHGKVFGAPMGEPPYRYYAEWEWPDLDAFKSAARSEEFMATGKDAMEMGGSFTRHVRGR